MWVQCKKCSKQEFLSLIGKLSFICKVVHPGRIFLRRLIDLSTFNISSTLTPPHINKRGSLGCSSMVDNVFTYSSWNCHTLITQSFLTNNSDLKLFTDASWIQAPWPSSLQTKSIDFKEPRNSSLLLLPVLHGARSGKASASFSVTIICPL